jgi:hypothetical protein
MVLASKRSSLGYKEVSNVMLLVGLEHVVLQVRQQLAHPRVHDLVLDVGVHGQQLDDLVDQVRLAGGVARFGALELAEEAADLFVIPLEKDDRVGGHGGASRHGVRTRLPERYPARTH